MHSQFAVSNIAWSQHDDPAVALHLVTTGTLAVVPIGFRLRRTVLLDGAPQEHVAISPTGIGELLESLPIRPGHPGHAGLIVQAQVLAKLLTTRDGGAEHIGLGRN